MIPKAERTRLAERIARKSKRAIETLERIQDTDDYAVWYRLLSQLQRLTDTADSAYRDTETAISLSEHAAKRS